MPKKKKAEELTNYVIKKKFSLLGGADIKNLARAVRYEGFHFEQKIDQAPTPGNKEITVSFIFPNDDENVVVQVTGLPDNIAYDLARKLIDEEILKA